MDAGYEIEGFAAWENLLRSPSSRWTDGHDPGHAKTAHARLAGGIVIPDVEPKFRLAPDDVYFCIGSCFARNLEEHLIYRRLPVVSRSVPFADHTARPNGAINKYTPASILNELRWSLAGVPFPESALIEEDGLFRDLQLAARAPAAPLDVVLGRRAQVRDYFARMRGATVVIVTLGLVETWYDTLTGLMLNAAPSRAMTRRSPGRFRLVVTDYAHNVAVLREIFDILNRCVGGNVRIIVSVSPVPMSETFTGRDVIVANAYSKATLRAAADDSARAYANVDYYPSFEAITVSHRSQTYNAGDDLHVLDSAARLVAARFLEAYGAGGDVAHPEFVELDYLCANPDVHDAVVRQEFASGYEHWLAHGRAEGRSLRAERRTLEVERLVGP